MTYSDGSGDEISALDDLKRLMVELIARSGGAGGAADDVNVTQVNGAAAQTGHGTAAGALRVELPTDGTGVAGALDGSDITQGAVADAVVAAGAAGTVSAKLRRLTTDLDALNAKTSAAATRTVVVATVSSDGNVAAGKRFISFIFSTDFAGTIDGETFAGATDAYWEVPVLPKEDSYAALSYTISAGNARITSF